MDVVSKLALIVRPTTLKKDIAYHVMMATALMNSDNAFSMLDFSYLIYIFLKFYLPSIYLLINGIVKSKFSSYNSN